MLIWEVFNIIVMRKIWLIVSFFVFIAGCNNQTETIDDTENSKSDNLNIIKIRNPAYEYENIDDIVDRYRYVQKGYDLLDSTLTALDTTNITEDDITYILYISTLFRKNQAFLFAEQYKIRALYCSKIFEALEKCKVKEREPECYEIFCADMDTLTEKENMLYFKFAADYLYINEGESKLMDSSRDISSFVR